MSPPRTLFLTIAAALLVPAPAPASPTTQAYAWQSPGAPVAETLAERIAPPPGFQRIDIAPESWGAWLRGLPMKPAGAPVLLFTGAPKGRQDVHAAVIDIDVGTRDLQQCADAIMRLRAEWQFAAGRPRDIGFNYTDGKRRAFASRRQTDYAALRKYMNLVSFG
jgi:hypothetical protein